MKFKYCPLCGRKLINKYSYDEGQIPYCEEHKILFFNVPKPCIVVAVIKDDQILLLKQSYIYKNSKVLISGYVSVGEALETAVKREVLEETGITVDNVSYVGSNYIKDKELVMISFAAKYKSGTIKKSDEVEWAGWENIDKVFNEVTDDYIGREVLGKILKKFK